MWLWISEFVLKLANLFTVKSTPLNTMLLKYLIIKSYAIESLAIAMISASK